MAGLDYADKLAHTGIVVVSRDDGQPGITVHLPPASIRHQTQMHKLALGCIALMLLVSALRDFFMPPLPLLLIGGCFWWVLAKTRITLTVQDGQVLLTRVSPIRRVERHWPATEVLEFKRQAGGSCLIIRIRGTDYEEVPWGDEKYVVDQVLNSALHQQGPSVSGS